MVSAADCSKFDMLSCREETKTAARVSMATKDRARVRASASPVECGVSGTSGRFAYPLLPTAMEVFR